MPLQLHQVLQEAPGLFDAFSGQALSAMIATSKDCRSQAHSQVTEVTLPESRHLLQLLKVSRPSTSRISVVEQHPAAGEVLYTSADIAMVRSSFVMLREVCLSFSRLGPSGVELLVSAHAPVLQVLHLSGNNLGVQGMQHLAKGNWPLLEDLQLSCTRLDAQALAELNNGSWPELHKLNLRKNSLHFLAGDHLGAAAVKFPKLTNLELACNRLYKNLGRVFNASSPWLNLEILELSHCHLEASDLQSLATAQLPQLKRLTLDHNYLQYDAMQQLVKGRWPHLIYLSIEYDLMDGISVALLQQACWSLKGLRLVKRSRPVDHDEEMRALTQANWPDLQYLALAAPDHSTVARLCEGNWPWLRHLDVSVDVLDVSLVGLLQGSSWHDLKSLSLSTCRISPFGTLFFGIMFDEFPMLQQKFDDRGIITFSEFSSDGSLPRGSAARALWPELECLYLRKMLYHWEYSGDM